MALFLTLLLLLPSLAFAATSVDQTGDGAIRRGQAENQLKVALLPDVQNYCTSDVGPATPGAPTAAELAEGPRQLDILVADIIAEQPDFVLQLGDNGDQAGSNWSDEHSGTGTDDQHDVDNFTVDKAKWGEYVCLKEHLYGKLDQAKIPWFNLSGNHDSYLDFERAFPRAEFLRRSWAWAAQNEVDRWAAGVNDTEERAALFQTGIGPVCVVSGDYQNSAALDQTFITNNIGCVSSGVGNPTILASHGGIGTGLSTIVASSANYKIFMLPYGHWIYGALEATSTQAAGGFNYWDVYTNGQESSLSCGANSADLARRIHTGTGNWTLVQVVPALNRLVIQTKNALAHNYQTHPCNYSITSFIGNFSPVFCVRFPGARGCGLAADAVAPTAPGSFTSPITGPTTVILTWAASVDAVGAVQYLIERCTGVACSPTVQTGATTADVFVAYQTGLTVATTYGFRMRARDGSGNLSAYTATIYAVTTPDITNPTPPTVQVITYVNGNTLRVRWVGAGDDVAVDHYSLERCTGVGCSGFAEIAQPALSPNIYLDTPVVSGTSYSYRMRAYDGAGNVSIYSNTQSFVMP